MKHFSVVAMIGLGITAGALFTPRATAQIVGDSSIVRTDTTSHSQRGFIDKDGDGIDDRRTGKGQRNDKFIDADGDGICDGRENGLGFRGGKGNGLGKNRQWRGGKK